VQHKERSDRGILVFLEMGECFLIVPRVEVMLAETVFRNYFLRFQGLDRYVLLSLMFSLRSVSNFLPYSNQNVLGGIQITVRPTADTTAPDVPPATPTPTQ
jgi:hypothetical protein